MSQILSPTFFNRPTLLVAEELLGKYLVIVDQDGNKQAHIILEVEAYDGPLDQASHAFRGQTERTSIMFGPAGFWYIYLIYGMYWMLNIVTGPEAYPAAILIRTVGPYDGPGKLTKRLGIDKRFHQKLASKKTGLWMENRGPLPSSFKKETTPRIGVAYAGPIWSQKPYRFIARKN